ncbi:MAG: hypothetical protein WCJ81_00280 [bacterium]
MHTYLPNGFNIDIFKKRWYMSIYSVSLEYKSFIISIPNHMSKIIDIFVVYQENGLPHEKMIELPAGLSNLECMTFIRESVGESANILNIINVDSINRQKTAPASAEAKAFSPRPEFRRNPEAGFSRGETRPYGARSGGGFRGRSDDRPSGGYAGRSPRDGAKPARSGGFGARPSRGDSRDSRM